MYHNTTHSTGEEVKRYRKKVQTQEQMILAFFRANANFKHTASDVLRAMLLNAEVNHNVPLTSIRRGITNLMTSRKIEKTTHQRTGPYGRPEYCYRLASGQGDLFQ